MICITSAVNTTPVLVIGPTTGLWHVRVASNGCSWGPDNTISYGSANSFTPSNPSYTFMLAVEDGQSLYVVGSSINSSFSAYAYSAVSWIPVTF